MLLAPRREQMAERQYLPPTPTAALRRTGSAARALAEPDRALRVDGERLSEPFRRICATSLETLQSAPGKAH